MKNQGLKNVFSLRASEFLDEYLASPHYAITWCLDDEGGCIIKALNTGEEKKWTYDDLSGYWSAQNHDSQLGLCNHKWTLYDSGLTRYEFCETCDETRPVQEDSDEIE